MKHPGNPDFMKKVEEIKASEAQADKLKEEAAAKSESIVRRGKETALKLRAETEEEVTKLKDKKLHAGSKEIESEVQEILDAAKKDASSIRKKDVKDSKVSEIAESLLSEQ